ncbi:Nitroreductase [Xylariaceae sp. FL1272]|nr:Nitroreductase [Xylariaceae sp. FL1272]
MADIESLIKNRYGTSEIATHKVANIDFENPTLVTLLQHTSVRHFLPEKLPEGNLEIIVAAAQSAATSSHLQTWSVVAIEDPDRKDKAATLCGDQDFIRQAPLYLIFCADLSRLTKVSAQYGLRGEGLEFTEMFLMASLDAGLAGQNAAVAAEALGLGICYVGGARNNSRELGDLLKLPPRVIAVFGMAVGKPDPSKPAVTKPRLPQSEILHRETWHVAEENGDEQAQDVRLKEFDETMKGFNALAGRSDMPSWTQRSAKRVETVQSLTGRHVLKDFLRENGFQLR